MRIKGQQKTFSTASYIRVSYVKNKQKMLLSTLLLGIVCQYIKTREE